MKNFHAFGIHLIRRLKMRLFINSRKEQKMIPYLTKGQGNILMTKTEEKATEKIVFSSNIMKQLLKTVNRIANTDTSVLIFGRSGTGKEIIGRKIHNNSYRKNSPFLIINCSCLNENTVESELFGHEKGAFTGAIRQKVGILEKANGGTLFLDGVSDLNSKTQTKLLRLLQEGEVYRVGGVVPIKLNLRVIACSSKNLAKEVTKGRFREDLYYRLNTISISLPSLSERPEDIPVLLKHFLGSVELEDKALKTLANYSWPGNVRELKNLCERWRVLYSGHVFQAQHLPDEFFGPKKPVGLSYDPNMSLADLNKAHILNSLQHFSSKRKAAKALGITVKTLYNRLHEYGIFDDYAMHSSFRANIDL